MPDLPEGTVTFLYTDIEGSTKRWEHHPDAMNAAVERHDTLLRQAIEANGGRVFRTEGDAFRAAFPTAPQSLRAALDGMRALCAELWADEIGSFRVRMALYTGEAEVRGGDYVGISLNRIARLLSSAHGDQIVLSLPTEQLLRDSLPPGVTLRDLGEHRLKDLIHPEHVFQVVAQDLPSDFPPLSSLDNRPNNLPVQPTLFIGREKELAAVKALLERQDGGLLTLTGPGGTGKTRLALQVAADLIEEFQHGVFFVNLAPISDPNLVASEIAQTLGVREAGSQSLIEIVKEYLCDKQILLVLDNFEQVVQAAPLVQKLLSAAVGLKVLATSREILHLYGEREFPVPPLALPDARRLPPLEQLTRYEAVRLFIERAMNVNPGFHVTNENAPAVAEICHRLDGLPLAIELAAARIRLLPPQAMLTKLQTKLKLLTGGPRDLPARQQTLRNAIEWSYDLLDEGERQLFRRLSVFQGGRTLEAIEAVCDVEVRGEGRGVSAKEVTPRPSPLTPLQIDVLDGVESLLGKSLLKREEDLEGLGEVRFVMLETIHEYARERLEESDEEQAVCRLHAHFFLDLVEQSEPKLQGHEQLIWLRRLEAEYDNIRVALRWATEHEAELGLRMSGALSPFWELRGYLSESRYLLKELLSQPETMKRTSGQAPRGERAKALKVAGNLADTQGDYAAAKGYYDESLAIYREIGDKRGIAGVLNGLGVVAWNEGDFASARSFLEESLAIKRELKDQPSISATLSNLGLVAHGQGDYASARSYLEESLAIDRTLKDDDGMATSLVNLGAVALDEGDYQKARSLLVESLPLFQEVGDIRGVADCLENLMALEGQDGHERNELAKPRRGGRAHRAPVLGGAAEALREESGAPLSPTERARYDGYLGMARSHLDQAAWERQWAEGRAMTMEQAVAYALKRLQS